MDFYQCHLSVCCTCAVSPSVLNKDKWRIKRKVCCYLKVKPTLLDGSLIFKPEGQHEVFSDLIKYTWVLQSGRLQSDFEGWNAFCLLSVQIVSQRPEARTVNIHAHGFFIATKKCLKTLSNALWIKHVRPSEWLRWWPPGLPEGKYVGWGEGQTWGRCAIWRAALSLNWCEVRWKWRWRRETKGRVGVGAVGRMEGRAGKLICLGDGRRRRGDWMGEGWGEGENECAGINWKWMCPVVWVTSPPQPRLIPLISRFIVPSSWRTSFCWVETLWCDINMSHNYTHFPFLLHVRWESHGGALSRYRLDHNKHS